MQLGFKREGLLVAEVELHSWCSFDIRVVLLSFEREGVSAEVALTPATSSLAISVLLTASSSKVLIDSLTRISTESLRVLTNSEKDGKDSGDRKDRCNGPNGDEFLILCHFLAGNPG